MPRNRIVEFREAIGNDAHFLGRAITGDETGIFSTIRKLCVMEWHTPNCLNTKKKRMSKSKIKNKLVCFFDSQGIVHK